MSTISASTTSTTGFKVTSDTTGTLVFQTGASPTTAMSISSSQIISFTNPPTATGGGGVSSNTAYGSGALAANTTGARNTAIGAAAAATETTASAVTAVGYGALNANTGDANTAVGEYALQANTSGNSNTAVGYRSLYSNIVATNNTAVGYQALYTNTASDNTVVGWRAGYANTSGGGTIAVGGYALTANTTGNSNNAFGYAALYTNTTGSYNCAFGQQALYSNTTAGSNVAIGYQALYLNTTGAENTAVGYQAGNSVTTGYGNAFFGRLSGTSTTGYNNTFYGGLSGYLVTTGNNNTILGRFTGNGGGLDIRTASNYIVLSDGDGNPRGYYDGSIAFWKFIGAQSNGSAMTVQNTSASPNNLYLNFNAATPNNTTNYFLYADDSTTVRAVIRSNGGLANYSANNVNLSDRREKTNFAPAGDYLAKICAIPVQTYNYIDQNLEEDDGLTLGVVAQDVQAVAPELVTESNWGTEEEPKMRLSIYQTDLQYALMKCIQEQQAIIETLTNRITALEAK